MPVVTEDAGKSRQMQQYGHRAPQNTSRFEAENGGIRSIETTTDLPIRLAIIINSRKRQHCWCTNGCRTATHREETKFAVLARYTTPITSTLTIDSSTGKPDDELGAIFYSRDLFKQDQYGALCYVAVFSLSCSSQIPPAQTEWRFKQARISCFFVLPSFILILKKH